MPPLDEQPGSCSSSMPRDHPAEGPLPQPTDFRAARRRMVDEQLRARGIADRRVLDAMDCVPREEFVSDHLRNFAYDDSPLPIGFGQTISQPFTVAFQCEALKLQGDERALEIGTGSGYAAAVLAQLAKEVFTVERVPGLSVRAEATLKRLGYGNVHCFTANGTLGLPDHAPFNAIVVTAGGKRVPPPLLEQLAENGRIVMPIGESILDQSMCRLTKVRGEMRVEYLGEFAFVPLIGRHGWNEAPSHQQPRD